MKFVCLLLMLVIFFQFSLESQSQTEIGLVYFLPSDRTAQSGIDSKINTLIQGVQTVYANRMSAAGYGSKTFTFGATVHHVTGGQFTMRIMILRTSGKFGTKFGQKDMNLQKRSTLHLLI